MALTLSLSYTERNDNKLLTINDTTADWGVGGNIDVTDVIALTLDIVITDSSGTATTYDQIDLVAEFGDGVAPEFNNQAALEFEIDASMLQVSGVAYGTSDDELPDGIWNITYDVNTSTATLVEDVLINGVVTAEVYELLRVIPTIYNCSECKSKQILDSIYCKALLDVMESDAYASMTEELIDQLYTLERLIDDGSSYSW